MGEDNLVTHGKSVCDFSNKTDNPEQPAWVIVGMFKVSRKIHSCSKCKHDIESKEEYMKIDSSGIQMNWHILCYNKELDEAINFLLKHKQEILCRERTFVG